MGVYLRGNAVTIVQRFFMIDALDGVSTPADPSTITFTVIDPDGGETKYVFGTDVNVTRTSTGVYLCALAPPLPPGSYRYGCVGTGAVEAASDGTFTVLESGTDLPIYPVTAQYGPCNVWIDGNYVNEWTGETLGLGSSSYLLDPYAEFASQIMYELTARQFQGTCQRKVRPCRQACQCFGSDPALGGLGPWFWPSSYSANWWGGWSWTNECGDICGCGNESYIRLAGYPVQRILEVKLNGGILVEGVDYRLDGRRDVIRLADPASDPAYQDRFWPGCQDLSKPDTLPGTYSVTYEWGAPPPEGGKLAAAQLAVELWKASPGNGGECKLPNRVTRVVRQGIEMDRVVPLADMLRAGQTGLGLVDAFIAMTNPQKAKRRSAVFSPDIDQFARQVGQDEYGT
jgi:hypothetical protein